MACRMDFLNPEVFQGLNVTVRRGDKWFNKARPGDIIIICKTGERDVLSNIAAKIIGLAYLPFSLVGPFLCYEHDSTCNNLYGLMIAMQRAYPDFKFDEMVTVVMFKV